MQTPGGHRYLLLPLLAVFTILRGPVLCAQSDTEVGPDVVAFVVPLNGDAEVFAAVVAAAIELRLNPTGVNLDIRTLHHQSGNGQPTNDALTRQATTAAEAILICRFSVVDREMTAAMDWQDIRKRAHFAVSERKAQLDLSLDEFMLHVLDALLVQVQDRIDDMAARKRAAAAAAAAKPVEAVSTAAAPQEPAVVAVRPTVEDDTSTRRFLLSTGIAPFIPIGAASSYFSLGYMYSASGSIVFTVPSGRIGVGISTGVISFTPQGASGTSTSFLIPVGLNASYHLGGSSMAGLLLHLTGGAAVLFVSSPTLGTRVKTVPFLAGAIGLELLFSRTVGVLLDAAYQVYFEMPLLIMGISPALEISLRL